MTFSSHTVQQRARKRQRPGAQVKIKLQFITPCLKVWWEQASHCCCKMGFEFWGLWALGQTKLSLNSQRIMSFTCLRMRCTFMEFYCSYLTTCTVQAFHCYPFFVPPVQTLARTQQLAASEIRFRALRNICCMSTDVNKQARRPVMGFN